MKIGLEDYEPLGHQVLLKMNIRDVSEGGIILDKSKASKWMEVTKIGSMVSSVEPGDMVVMSQPHSMVQLKFGKNQYLQFTEHDIAGKVPLGKIKLEDIIKS